ncbi:MAG: FtsX-like permease family protein [Balneolaceae bacterium]|nr:FtsX-like permease family protein [Balneolaceae bacterium]MDR9446398.1 FtsX-like permease family protein [Balneolaceae bacterium]
MINVRSRWFLAYKLFAVRWPRDVRSTLSFLSILGIALGTSLLIAILSVFNGFYAEVQSMLLSEDPHVRITAIGKPHVVPESAQVEWLQQQLNVDHISLRIEGKAILMGQEGSRGEAKLLTVMAESQIYEGRSSARSIDGQEGAEDEGHDSLDTPNTYDLSERVLYGDSDLSVKDGRPGVLISLNQANQQGWSIDDPIGLLSAPRLQQALTSVRPTRPLIANIRGFTASHPITGEPTATLDMGLARRLLRVPVGGTSLDIRLQDFNDAGDFLIRMDASGVWPSDQWRLQTWYDQQKSLYDVMQLEKRGATLILFMIVLVALLNIVGSLTMMVIQKRKEIAILRTMGLSKRELRSLFWLHGVWLGLVGAGFGTLLGMGLVWLQGEFGLLRLSTDFLLDAYPVQLQGGDVLTVLLGTTLCCVAATILPSRRAMNQEPIQALHSL